MTPLLRGSVALHAAGVAALAAAPGVWPWIVGACVADHALLVAAGLSPRSRWLGPNLVRLPVRAAARGEVGLSFDDGPDPEVTPQVLDLLDVHGARASFFPVGLRLREHRDLGREVARRGHALENHTFAHPHAFSVMTPWAIAREIDAAQEAVAEIAGRAPRLFRAPAGLRPPFLEFLLARRGLRLTSWTRRGFDTVTNDPIRVAARLTRGLAAGDVLLLHDGRAARAASGRPVVLEALPRVLEAIARAGLHAVPLSSGA